MAGLRLKKSEMKKAAVTGAVGILLAVLFYKMFNPSDVPGVLTYAIFFVLAPVTGVYCIADIAFKDRQEKAEIIE